MSRYGTVIVLSVVAMAAAAPSAAAKISCAGSHPAAASDVKGLPAQPVADVEYQASFTVPRAVHANPSPIAMFIRCGDPNDDPSFTLELPGAGPVEIPLRFSEPGRWRGTVMDRGGTFHSLGTIDVSSALAVAPAEPAGGGSAGDEDGGVATAAILAGVGLLGVGLLFRARRRHVAKPG